MKNLFTTIDCGVADCPIKDKVGTVVEAGHTMAAAIRQMKASLVRCRKCSRGEDCGLINEWNQQVREAVEDVTRELSLSDWNS